jgi:deoxyribodipyrimidine photo-lyase
MKTVIVWLRQDLRLIDNPALTAAIREGETVIPVYIHCPREYAAWPPGGASRWWLHHSLRSLDESLHKIGSRLVVRTGSSHLHLIDIVNQSGARAVYCNRLIEPALAARDLRVKQALSDIGVPVYSSNGALLFTPETLMTQDGRPYRVFTPYWKKCQQLFFDKPPLPAPRHLGVVPAAVTGMPVTGLNLLSKVDWYDGLRHVWNVGEMDALRQLDEFCESALAGYKTTRDRPDIKGTSRLSPYLHFGQISPRQVVWRLHQIKGAPLSDVETFTKELVWREFAHHILHYHPNIIDEPLDSRFQRFPFASDSERLLEAWQKGRTGYPLVDAGMRELWSSGWMHNRVRMVAASFLTKNSLISWAQGARWFWDTLVDADLANNSFNWQWCAGCGADAAPYFRIFNPVTQSQKFDPQGHYIKRWLPELAALPEVYIHEPWRAPRDVQQQSGAVMGKHYPLPVLNLNDTRLRALRLYQQHIKKS